MTKMMKIREFRVTSFEDADTQLGVRFIRRLCRDTLLIRRHTTLIAVEYHNTDIVLYDSIGGISINSGGWRTSTTKQRMNRCLPEGFYVYQKRGVWLVYRDHWDDDNGADIPFEDGMELVG